MKKRKIIIIVYLLVFASVSSTAQDFSIKGFIMLDSLTNNFAVTHYTLSTKELYDIDKKIEIYNVPMRKGEILLVFSVLPDFKEKENWKKENIAVINEKILSLSAIRDYAVSISNLKKADPENINTLKFALVKKIDNDYYISNVCLTERFNVYNYPYPLTISQKRTVNLGGPFITIKDFHKKLPQYTTPMNPENDHSFLLERDLLENFYLSRKMNVRGKNAYQFWTFTDWQVMDGWNIQRGIDRFIYMPGKGIVGGSYDFWFAFKPPMSEYSVKNIPVKASKLWDNIINERVMIAEELK